MGKGLLDFHRAVSKEYREILKRFNILFYGVGRKNRLLEEIFPGSLILDGSLSGQEMSHATCEYFGTEPRTGRGMRDTLEKVNGLFKSRRNKKVIVIMGYEKCDLCLRGLDNLRMVVTMEASFNKFPHEDLVECNFVCRNLSTLEAARRERGRRDKAEEAMNIYRCVGPRAQKVFKLVVAEALSGTGISLQKLFEREKKRLLIMRFSIFRNALLEFYDGKVLDDRDGVTRVHLSKRDLLKLRELLG
jgi:hypothetical protein